MASELKCANHIATDSSIQKKQISVFNKGQTSPWHAAIQGTECYDMKVILNKS